MEYIDLHCDTLSLCAFSGKPVPMNNNSFSVDFERMRKAGCAAQFFAVFFSMAGKA
jgi:membrane dipeptidase